MKVIVAGSRGLFIHKDEVAMAILDVEQHVGKKLTEIVSGGAYGPDKAGEYYAKNNNIPVKLFIPDWNTNGKAAGPIRNKQMADYADVAIVFWDQESRGSKSMIDEMEKLGKQVLVIKCEQPPKKDYSNRGHTSSGWISKK